MEWNFSWPEFSLSVFSLVASEKHHQHLIWRKNKQIQGMMYKHFYQVHSKEHSQEFGQHHVTELTWDTV